MIIKIFSNIALALVVCASVEAMESVAISPIPSAKLTSAKVRTYIVKNVSTDKYTLDQERTRAYCDDGDSVIGGGGACPHCDAGSQPACGKIPYDISSAPVDSPKEGWGFYCDLMNNSTYDSIATYAICIDNEPYR